MPITRASVAKAFPIYVDRRQAEQDFIVERLNEDPHIEAVVEANGGSTFFGDGILKVSRRIVLIEEGALFQLRAEALGGAQDSWRRVVSTAAQLGVPVPGFSAALAYYDGLRAERLPAALIQGQRDFFGAHTYRRVDRDGAFHTLWGGDRDEVSA